MFVIPSGRRRHIPLGDFAYAARTLRKNLLFTITVAITLALGIGASTAIFSVTNAVLLRPLPYHDPERLVVAVGEMKKRNVQDWPFSSADFFDLRSGTRQTFHAIAGVSTWRDNLAREDGTPEEVRFAGVTPNFFRTVGARIAFGRDFTDEDGRPQPPRQQDSSATEAQTPQRLPNVAILNYEYFERRFGGNPSIIGKPTSSGGPDSPEIVGVLAPGFQLLFPPGAHIEATPDIWYAARLDYDNAQRNSVFLHVIGRLEHGVTLDRAQSAADRVAAEVRRNFPIHKTAGFAIQLEPMKKHLVAAVAPAILALLGAVLFLLLIACANVANLMLVRLSSRERELAVRASLGGSRWALVRQTLAESLLLASVGTLFGLALAWLGAHELLVIAPANLPRLESTGIDPAVLAFAGLAGLASVALFGVIPALRAARPDVMQVLRGSGRTAALGASGLRQAVVIAEIALCFVLLVGSGLMFRSFLALQQIDLGYDPRGLLTFELLGQTGSTPQARRALSAQIRDRLRALPGVQNVTAATPFPLTGGFDPIRWGTAQALVDASKFQAVDPQIVLPGYFETMRTPLIAGRTFTEADNDATRSLVVIDQALAAKAFPSESAIGKRILIRLRSPEPEWVQIIGVVAHQRTTSLAEPGRDEIFFTDGFPGHGVASRWAVRTSGNPAGYAEAIRKEIAQISPALLITRMLPMQTWVEQAQASTRFSLQLIGVFAVVAALLAGVGLYGVLSSAVRQRTAEIGVRVALGAPPAKVFSLIVGNGLRLTALGIVLGIAAALALTRLMTTMLVGVKASDPVTFCCMIMLFVAVASLASWLPARRASALDPTAALRDV